MPDVYSDIANLDEATQESLAAVLETRGADPGQQEMRQAFLGSIPLPAGARVLEVGSGTGVLVRRLARWPGVATVCGVEPAPSLVTKARELSAGLSNVTYEVADGRALPFADGEFDAVIFDSTLCHMADPALGLREALRVLRQQGVVAAFDGDYATATVALGDHDPLQICVDAMMAQSVNDRWLARRLVPLFRQHAVDIVATRSHGYVDHSGGYMLTVVERGVDFLEAAGRLTPGAADALKAEARERIASGTFFGHIAYFSAVGRKA